MKLIRDEAADFERTFPLLESRIDSFEKPHFV